MELIDGLTSKKVINSLTGVEEKKAELQETLEKIGTVVAQLHDAGIIHGDLTTSNILIRSQSNQAVVIDFGLSFVSHTSEDKAVDLYVLERAFGSTHPELEEQFPEILKFYAAKSKSGADVMKRLEQGPYRKCPFCICLSLTFYVFLICYSSNERKKEARFWLTSEFSLLRAPLRFCKYYKYHVTSGLIVHLPYDGGAPARGT
jgi:serine/threonine protein kinase